MLLHYYTPSSPLYSCSQLGRLTGGEYVVLAMSSVSAHLIFDANLGQMKIPH